MDDGRFEEAARAFREAAEASPDDAEAWGRVAHAELFAERPWRARDAFEQVARLRPGDPHPLVEIGFTFELERAYDHALERYLAAEAVAPESAYAYRVTGTRLLRWGKAALAIEHLARAVALEPAHEETANALGLAYYHAGRLVEAEQAFRDGLARHPESQRLSLGLAALLVNAQRYEDALAVYDEVVAHAPRFAAAHIGRALLLDELGRRAEAEAALVVAVEVAEDKREARRRLEAYRQRRASLERAERSPAAVDPE
jgi:Flp pilus assembly protein TadD